MINKKRKGFTIVELVIVIVIVGVLAAVLIPTFGSLIKKANESADMQTVYQMNIILAAELIKNEDLIAEDGSLNRDKFKEILAANGIDLDNLEPSSEDLEFKWDSNNKVVILVRPSADGSTLTQIYPPVNGGDGTVGSGVVDLNATPVENISTIDVDNGGTYYLEKDLTITSESPLAISSGATITLNLNGKTLTIGSSQADLPNSANVNAGNVVLATATAATGETPLINVSSGTLNINGGKIISTAGFDDYENSLGLVVGERGTLNLDGTNLELFGEFGIQNNPGGTVNINGGVFTVVANHSSVYNLLLYNIGGTMTVTGTTFQENGDPIYYASSAPIYNEGGTIDMEGVSISSSRYCTAGAPTETADGKITIDASSTLTLTGEKHVAPCENYYAYNAFDDDPTNNDCAYFKYEEHEEHGDTDGIYFDIKKACADGKPIELDENFTLENSIVVNETPTIDLNGKTLTIDKEGLFTGNGTLNITGSGTLDIDCYVKKCFSGFSGKLSVCGDEGAKINVIVNDSAISELFTALNKGYEFKNCTLEYSDSGDTLSVDGSGVVSLAENNVTLYDSISAPEGSTVTIDLNGHDLETGAKTITVPSTSTLSIKNGNIGRSVSESLFVAGTDGNMGEVNLEDVGLKHDAFLGHIMENNNITASTVSINDKATITKSITDGKINTTITLTNAFTLPCDLSVAGGDTLTINLDGNTLTNDKIITVEKGENVEGVDMLTVNGGTVSGTVNGTVGGSGSFIVKDGGSLSISNSTINNSIAVTGSTLTISDSTVSKAITADSASNVSFTVVDVTMPQADFFNLLTVVMASNDSTMTTVNFYEGSTHYLTVTNSAGKETAIILINTFALSQPLTIPAGYDMTINLNNRELQVTTNKLEVSGKLTIVKADTGGGGNLSCTGYINVYGGGELVLNANMLTCSGYICVHGGGELVLNANSYKVSSLQQYGNDGVRFVNQSNRVSVPNGYTKTITPADGKVTVTATPVA